MKFITRKAVVRLAVLLAVLIVLGVACGCIMIRMPGKSHRGPLPPLSDDEKAIAAELRRDVAKLASEIGARSGLNPKMLAKAADFIEEELKAAGYEVKRQAFLVDRETYWNLEAELRGTEGTRGGDEIVVVGAHYDSVDEGGCPGANDNASGVAAVLALARRFAGQKPSRTLRFVAFANEEPPYFFSKNMGSRAYARGCRERGENVVAMFSLETIGYYTDRPGSQKYPPPLSLFYPSTGNFIAFVGNLSSRKLVHTAIASFRTHAAFPSDGIAAPWWIPGIFWSDHWSFWKEGYPALMITDTAPFRYPYYHTADDTADKLDYERTARVVAGLRKVVEDLTKR